MGKETHAAKSQQKPEKDRKNWANSEQVDPSSRSYHHSVQKNQQKNSRLRRFCVTGGKRLKGQPRFDLPTMKSAVAQGGACDFAAAINQSVNPLVADGAVRGGY